MKSKYCPVIKRDGRYNIKKIGMHKADFKDFYYLALKMPWSLFLLCVVCVYLLLNWAFAVLYVMCGPQALSVPDVDLWTAFLFSIQTSSTIGYGHIVPVSQAANVIVVVESILSLLFVALTTGLAFAKFSRPTARVVFSNSLLLTTHNHKKVLMFRVGNVRVNQIVDASVNVVMLKDEVTKEGSRFRRLKDLKLVRNTSPMFALSWSVMHVVDQTSPLYNMTKADFEKYKIDFIVTLTGIDDTFAQQIHAKKSYGYYNLKCDAHFEDIIDVKPNGIRYIDFRKFHELKKKS